MGFRKIETPLEGLWLIEPDVFADARGYFLETYNQNSFAAIGLDLRFVQDNLSFSSRGTLRGLHFQAPPSAQGKLVSVPMGEVMDVAVDIRKASPTYGHFFAALLNAENKRMMYIPPGFAHGFEVLSETCLFSYKCTGFYDKAAEGGLMWNDPAFAIPWKSPGPVLSEKDRHYKAFNEFISPF